MVKHSLLFKKLRDRDLPPIFTRLLKVKWENHLSDSFSITNGLKQGPVLSAILFCIYVDDLIKQLSRNRTVLGKWRFCGRHRVCMICMFNLCHNHNPSFSTHENPRKSKTKCIAFLKKKRNLKNLALDEKKLPRVNSFKHLGTTLTDAVDDMGQDILGKRAQYIAKNNQKSTKVLANNIFNTHFYGTPLWDLFPPPPPPPQPTKNSRKHGRRLIG